MVKHEADASHRPRTMAATSPYNLCATYLGPLDGGAGLCVGVFSIIAIACAWYCAVIVQYVLAHRQLDREQEQRRLARLRASERMHCAAAG